MPLNMNVSGVRKDVVLWMNVSGAWKKVALWMNVSGAWKQITFLLSSLMPASAGSSDFAISPANASASLTLNADGTWDAVPGGAGTWRGGGTSAEYEARFTVTSGALSSGTAGSWLNLGTSRSWARNENRDGIYFESICTGTLEIRTAAAPNTILSSTAVTLTAVVEA